jgi:hypothetical protein
MDPAAPQFPEKPVNPLAFRHEKRFPKQFFRVKSFVFNQGPEDIFNVENPDYIIDGIPVQGKAGMFAFRHPFQQIVPGSPGGKKYRVGPGDHDLLHGGIRKVRDTPDHFPLIGIEGRQDFTGKGGGFFSLLRPGFRRESFSEDPAQFKKTFALA